MDLFTTLSVITFVILGKGPDGPVVRRKFRCSRADVRQHFPLDAGKPVFGPCVYRELTFGEMVSRKMTATVAEARKVKAADYLVTLVAA